METKTQATKTIVEKHLNAFILDLGVENIITDYSENAVFIAPDKVYQGKDEIRDFFKGFISSLPEGARDNFKLHSNVIYEDIAYIVWSVPGQVPMGTDTFIVRNDKILQQTFAMYTTV